MDTDIEEVLFGYSWMHAVVLVQLGGLNSLQIPFGEGSVEAGREFDFVTGSVIVEEAIVSELILGIAHGMKLILNS